MCIWHTSIRTPQIYGLDISDEMLVTAANTVERQGLRHRVKLAQGDATTFDGKSFGKLDYDRVLFSYTLSMIPDWLKAMHTAADRLAPGGELHIVDFGPCTDLPSLAKSFLYGWLNRFHVSPRLSLFSASEELAITRNMACNTALSHRGYAQHVVVLNH